MKDLTYEWRTHSDPVLFNFRNLYNAKVLKTEDPIYPYRMWIFGESVHEGNLGFNGYDAIFLARGKSLDSWEVFCGDDRWDCTMNPEKWAPVITAGNEIFDSFHNGDPSVVFKNGLYYMAFSSVGMLEINGENYIINCIMGATSVDGILWDKSKAPILIWDKEYVELWNAKEPCPPSTGGYHRPSILFDDGKWKLWFDYYLPGTFLSMGYAENSGDFLNPDDWIVKNCDQNPQLRNFPNPAVVKINHSYYAFSDAPLFSGEHGNHRQIVMAQSHNGYDWEICGNIRPENSTVASHLPEPYLEEKDGKLYLYVFYSITDKKHYPNYYALNYMLNDRENCWDSDGMM